MSESESVRLAKRLAEQEQCSRREAELHITAGNVQVDGKVVQLPETRVRPEQQVTLRSGAQPEAVRAAISSGDVATLTRVPGIGKKGAERIILELRDRVGAVREASGLVSAAPAWSDQVQQAPEPRQAGRATAHEQHIEFQLLPLQVGSGGLGGKIAHEMTPATSKRKV